jgi:hypothetical protein
MYKSKANFIEVRHPFYYCTCSKVLPRTHDISTTSTVLVVRVRSTVLVERSVEC